MLTSPGSMSRHSNELSGMTAAWLLPVVSTIVAAASGAIVASVLENEQHALWTIIVSYVLWGTGVPLAMMVMVMYFHRLTIHKIPPKEVIVSVFLPLGPLGQGSFGIMQLGKEAMRVFPKTNSLSAEVSAGSILYVLGFVIGLIMWGFGLVWLFFALASITRSKFPFNMGWWGFTFPLGVFTVATTTIAKELPSLFFKVLGTVSFHTLESHMIVSDLNRLDFLCGRRFTLDRCQRWHACSDFAKKDVCCAMSQRMGERGSRAKREMHPRSRRRLLKFLEFKSDSQYDINQV